MMSIILRASLTGNSLASSPRVRPLAPPSLLRIWICCTEAQPASAKMTAFWRSTWQIKRKTGKGEVTSRTEASELDAFKLG